MIPRARPTPQPPPEHRAFLEAVAQMVADRLFQEHQQRQQHQLAAGDPDGAVTVEPLPAPAGNAANPRGRNDS